LILLPHPSAVWNTDLHALALFAVETIFSAHQPSTVTVGAISNAMRLGAVAQSNIMSSSERDLGLSCELKVFW